MNADAPVAIVGSGPAGLATALCLARMGVASTVLERRPGPSEHPRAHWINERTMELFDVWGIADEVADAAYPVRAMPLDMIESLGGVTLEQRRRFSPRTVCSCAQDIVEGALRRRLAEFDHATIRWDTESTSVTQNDDGVVLELGGSNPGALRARWCVAADGAHSQIRRSLGIEMVGDQQLNHLINIYFIGELFPDEAVAPMLLAPSGHLDGGAFINMDGRARWCYHHPYDPSVETIDDFDDERCLEIIRSAIGQPNADLEIRAAGPWEMTAHVAERMRVGSVFLVGDAAHAFPPSGGMGLNSGVQDGHNLAWKLAAVHAGTASPALLDSYEEERRPIAFLNTAQSLRNGDRGVHGPNPAPQAKLIDELANQTVRSVAHEAADAEERFRRDTVDHAAAIGQILGAAYEGSSVIVPDGVERPDTLIATYIPNACPGARAPHLFLRHGNETVSSIAVFEGTFSLVVGDTHSVWREALDELPDETRPMLVAIGPEQAYVPVEENILDLYGIEPDGAVLVRPDGFVSYRSPTAPTDPTLELQRALRISLGQHDTASVPSA